MTSLVDILLLILSAAQFIVIAHVVISLLVNFQILNMRQPLVGQIYYGLDRLLDPIYRPIRRVLPDTGGLDFSPLVVLIAIYAIRFVVINNLGLVG
jgi:YggT family protein